MSAQKQIADMSGAMLQKLMVNKSTDELRAIEWSYATRAAKQASKGVSFSLEASIKTVAEEIERREYDDRLNAAINDLDLVDNFLNDDPFSELQSLSRGELLVLAKTEYAKSTLTTGYESVLLRLAALALHGEANRKYE